ncbi:Uncharacterised protein [uncultured archaeon]|nr:Uncharacterised protein [uncultured archaeon]
MVVGTASVHDLVERSCEVITTDVATVFNPTEYLSPFTIFHPVVCGKPAYDFVEYGDSRVYMCLEHWNACRPWGTPVDVLGTRGMDWTIPGFGAFPEYDPNNPPENIP